MFFTTVEEWIGLAIAFPICVWAGYIQVCVILEFAR